MKYITLSKRKGNVSMLQYILNFAPMKLKPYALMYAPLPQSTNTF